MRVTHSIIRRRLLAMKTTHGRKSSRKRERLSNILRLKMTRPMNQPGLFRALLCLFFIFPNVNTHDML